MKRIALLKTSNLLFFVCGISVFFSSTFSVSSTHWNSGTAIAQNSVKGSPVFREISQTLEVSPSEEDVFAGKHESLHPAQEEQEAGQGSKASTKTTFPTFQETRKQKAKELRFKLLSNLKFDRRPSMILRAWADLRAATSMAEQGGAPGHSQQEHPGQSPEHPSNTQSSAPKLSGKDLPPMPTSRAQMAKEDMEWMMEQSQQATKEIVQFDVWLKTGQWEKAGKFLRQFDVKQQSQIYQKMIASYATVERRFQSLAVPQIATNGAQVPGSSGRNSPYMEQHQFDVNDVEGLLSLAPKTLKDPQLRMVAAILKSERSFIGTDQDLQSLMRKIVGQTPNANFVEKSMGSGFVEKKDVKPTAKNKKEKKEKNRKLVANLTKRQVAIILLLAGKSNLSEEFVPSPKECEKAGDAEGLNILSTIYLSKEMDPENKDEDYVKKAWDTVQTLLANDKISQKEKNEALIRAISLAPRMEKEVREAWLNKKFSTMDQSSKELLAVIGEKASRGLQANARNEEARGRMLRIMKTATEVMLKNQKGTDVQQRALLTLLAKIWLTEAEVTKQFDDATSLGMKMKRDQYGNFYYDNYYYNNRYNSNRFTAIPTKTILDTLPEGKWFDQINPAIKPKVSLLCAGLLLKVSEEKRAFPYIEELYKSDKKAAQELAEEFLRVWTVNHDLNAQRNGGRYNPYYFSYGFNQSAQSIPLTRSKQERNLKELTQWVAKLRSLKGINVDQDLLADAFTTCHSGAEVYRLEEIEKVFGEMKSIKPDVLAALTEKMRINLKGLWRKPAVQKQAKTKRKKRQIQKEVVRGYHIALLVLSKAIKEHPKNWRLANCMACMLFDQNEYLGKLNDRKKYSERKIAAYQLFASSAQLYNQWAKTQPRDEWTVEVYQNWFNAMLGSPDLEKVDHEKIAATKQTPLIKQALASMEGKLAEEHFKRFATSVVMNVTRANPAVKFTYLNQGFQITGMREEVIEAKKLYEYYQDLVTELELEMIVDGSDEVSATQPFGVLVRINHTPEIERESGGFGRFLQNQNSMMYGYNFGRQTEDYRDKFEQTARMALDEDFEVLSVTFESDKVKSKPLNRSGWRYTPYAYLVLKPRGTEVDRIPSIRIDMDFLDTTGYVVLPIRSKAVPVKCLAKAKKPRPFKNLEITQTLDQREGASGKLTLEIKAKANGLVPSLEEILKMDPVDFEVVSTDDSRCVVNGFDKEKEKPTITSERTWEIELKGKEDLNKKPDTFHFAKANGESKMTLMSYQDEDVKTVEPVVVLKGDYGKPAFPWMPVIGGSSIAAIGLLLGIALFLGGGNKEVKPKKKVSADQMDTFQILGLLEQRLNDPTLNEDLRSELTDIVRGMEEEHFSSSANGSASSSDPLHIAKKWLN